MKRKGLNRRPVVDKVAPVVDKGFKDYALGFVHANIECLLQMADATTRRYLLKAIDGADIDFVIVLTAKEKVTVK